MPIISDLTARAAGFNVPDLYNEYNALSVQFAQAMNRDGAATIINDETEKATIMAIANNLDSNLNKCAPTAIIIDLNQDAAT